MPVAKRCNEPQPAPSRVAARAREGGRLNCAEVLTGLRRHGAARGGEIVGGFGANLVMDYSGHHSAGPEGIKILRDAVRIRRSRVVRSDKPGTRLAWCDAASDPQPPTRQPKSVKGLASRASLVHEAMRNCMRDERGPFEVGHQEPISSHRKLLRTKAMVVKRCGNAGTRCRQARSREASASEPLQKCRKRIRRFQNRGVTLPPGSARGMP
jgi:hypothetical protein